ncbi:MAG TPA: HNH endonuclease [Herpetosiphonaceae bacterium]
MRCVFCKSTSNSSKTVEHIIPESLGNTEHILPPGVVCDKCNNYFSREVEKPLLDSLYFTQTRFAKMIPNKRGKVPTIKGIHLNSATIIEVSNSDEGKSIFASLDKDNSKFIRSVLDSKQGTVILPIPVEPDGTLVARFIGKIAIEVLAQRALKVDGGLDEITEKEELDELRTFVRIGQKNREWPIHKRRIYPEDFVFYEQGYGTYEVLHEFDFLYTEQQELYFAIAIFGIEYVINMGGPKIDGYLSWLQKHHNASPLYLE